MLAHAVRQCRLSLFAQHFLECLFLWNFDSSHTFQLKIPLTPPNFKGFTLRWAELRKEFFFYWTTIINNSEEEEERVVSCHEVVMNVISIKGNFLWEIFLIFIKYQCNFTIFYYVALEYRFSSFYFVTNIFFFVKYFLPCVQIIVAILIHYIFVHCW